jgi:hypothetical protein
MSGLFLSLFLVACSDDPDSERTWTDDHIINGIFQALDTDLDGKIQPSEYARTALAAPPMHSIDTDQDGSLSPSEVLMSLKVQDPGARGKRSGRPPISIDKWRSSFPKTPAARDRWERIAFITAELRSLTRPPPTPTEQDLQDLAIEGGAAYTKELSSLKAQLTAARMGRP